jgi:hypothetical protein
VTKVRVPVLLLLVLVVLGWCRPADRSIQDASESAVVTYRWCPLHVVVLD